jgi:hypothetical protein
MPFSKTERHFYQENKANPLYKEQSFTLKNKLTKN